MGDNKPASFFTLYGGLHVPTCCQPMPRANLRALKRMRELGVLFVPSSGRWYSSIMDNFSGEARELIEGGYVLSYNGGFINRVGDPTPLTTCGLSNECANAIYAKGLELGLCMHVNVADGHVFVPDADGARLSGIDHRGHSFSRIRSSRPLIP